MSGELTGVWRAFEPWKFEGIVLATKAVEEQREFVRSHLNNPDELPPILEGTPLAVIGKKDDSICYYPREELRKGFAVAINPENKETKSHQIAALREAIKAMDAYVARPSARQVATGPSAHIG